MDLPLPPGGSEAQYFVQKSLANGIAPKEILSKLIHDFEQQCIFRKEQTFVAVCTLYHLVEDSATKISVRAFFDRYKDAELPLLTQVECALLRMARKISILSLYPTLRTAITQKLRSAPELVRLVRPPTALSMSYIAELEIHRRSFQEIKTFSEDDLRRLLESLLKTESAIEQDFKVARSKLTDSEIQTGGFEYYGVDGKHYSFKNILHNFNIEPRADLSIRSS